MAILDDDLRERLEEHLEDFEVNLIDGVAGELTLEVALADYLTIAEKLRDHAALDFDQLSISVAWITRPMAMAAGPGSVSRSSLICCRIA